MPSKLGELTGWDQETGEAVGRMNEGGLIRGHVDIRAGGMLVFVPGMGRWEPDPMDADSPARERQHTPRARDAGRPPGTTRAAGENVDPAERRREDAARRRKERQEAKETEEAARAAKRAQEEADHAAAIEAAAAAAAAAAAGDEPPADGTTAAAAAAAAGGEPSADGTT